MCQNGEIHIAKNEECAEGEGMQNETQLSDSIYFEEVCYARNLVLLSCF
jgi:hypothetical protein